MLLAQTQLVAALEPAGARAQSMGGTGAALPTEPASLYWNPAGLFFQNGLAMDVTLQFAGRDWPNTWGLTYTKYSARARQGAGMGLYRILEKPGPDAGNAFVTVLTSIYRTPLGLPLGFSFKYITERMSGEDRKNYVTGDVGLFLPLSGFLLGAGFQSVTQPDSRLFPYRVNLGLSWNYRHKVTLASQLSGRTWDEFKHPEQGRWAVGLEIAPSKKFSLQGGYSESPLERYWTGGLGLSSGRGARLHLGYQWHPDGGRDDRVFLSYGSRM
ncbi:MAG: hypothetical protein C4524_11675 [Candidatus Zixiibacteriota bacterium]|nr:MAG: hypothetical protein C4524_11675 [candidate division Zixibacteria bacterium]